MTFSFHGSLRGIPQPLREVASSTLGGWKTFRLLEVPAAMIGLVWNSMMSMAGGWFFLTVNEAFTLGNRDFRLPGIGSYMNEAINQGNMPAMIAAIVAMVVMIVAVDQLFWRPIVVWSQKYKIEETSDVDKPQSWVLSVLERSTFYAWIARLIAGRKSIAPNRVVARIRSRARWIRAGERMDRCRAEDLRWIVLVALAALVMWGAWSLLRLLIGLPLHDPATHDDWLHVVLALLASFVRTSLRGSDRRCLGVARGDSDRPVSALVAALAAADPGGRQLSRADAFSAGHVAPGFPARSVHRRLHRADAARCAVVHPVQRDRRRDRDPGRSERSRPGLPHEPAADAGPSSTSPASSRTW